jgi:hypothetical protein
MESPPHAIYKVESFHIEGPYTLRVRFDDESEQVINFRPVLSGSLYRPLRDQSEFEQVRIDREVHTLVWPNGSDFDPTTLHDWPTYEAELIERAAQWEFLPT